MDIVWFIAVFAFFGCSMLLVRLLTCLQSED